MIRLHDAVKTMRLRQLTMQPRKLVERNEGRAAIIVRLLPFVCYYHYNYEIVLLALSLLLLCVMRQVMNKVGPIV